MLFDRNQERKPQQNSNRFFFLNCNNNNKNKNNDKFATEKKTALIIGDKQTNKSKKPNQKNSTRLLFGKAK